MESGTSSGRLPTGVVSIGRFEEQRLADLEMAASAFAAGTAFLIQATVVDGDTGVASVTATVREPGGAAVATGRKLVSRV